VDLAEGEVSNLNVNISNHDSTIIWNGVYYFALSNYPHVSPWELKKLLVFIEFEKQHGRYTEVDSDDDAVIEAVNHAIANPELYMNAVLPDKITECTYCNHNGCLTKFVCHTATPDNAKKIFESGKLLSAVKAFNKTGADLVLDARNAAGDPEDYFDYVMFSWGNCTAGDNLVMERLLGRGATNDEREKALTPGVRFYFRYSDIICHPDYVFDGYHPAKIKDELVLSDYLYACIVPNQFQSEFENLIQSEIADKVCFFPQDGLGLLNWTQSVYSHIEKLDETKFTQRYGGK